MKKVFLLFLVLFLVSCSTSELDLEQELRNIIKKEEITESFKPNNSKRFYSYYLPLDVGKIYSNSTSSFLVYNENTFLINLNINSIIDEDKNPKNYDDSVVLLNLEGEYIDFNSKYVKYYIDVIQRDDYYFINVYDKNVSLISKGNKTEILQVSSKMIEILKSVVVNNNEVLSYFSRRDTVQYTSDTIKLFDNILPENGKVQDLMEGSKGIRYINDGSEIYRTDDYEE